MLRASLYAFHPYVASKPAAGKYCPWFPELPACVSPKSQSCVEVVFNLRSGCRLSGKVLVQESARGRHDGKPPAVIAGVRTVVNEVWFCASGQLYGLQHGESAGFLSGSGTQLIQPAS